MTGSTTRSFARVLALTVLGAASVLLSPSPVTPAAGAATCTSAGGVSVVVDFRELGGSTVTACAPDGGGRSAAAVFASVGVDISYATRQPGFVCRVESVPESDPCVNTSPLNAFWGLWWADGSKASWTYSSSGVGGLTVPAGGSVGWSWQQDREDSGVVPPSVAPPVAPAPTSTPTSTPTGTPSSSPTSSPTASGSGGGAGGSGGGSGSGGRGGGGGGAGGGQASASPGADPSASTSTSPSATPSKSAPSPTGSPAASESPSDPADEKADEKAAKETAEEPTRAPESPSDSSVTEDADALGSASEPPSDSAPSARPEGSTAGEPARVPAALTWGIVGLLAVAAVASAVVARRRRGPEVP